VAELRFGSVVVTIPDGVSLPEEAGKLGTDEVRRLAKARNGVKNACDETARAIEATQGSFVPPSDVTPESLRAAGQNAAALNGALASLETAITALKQAHLMFENHAHKSLGKVNDNFKAQSKHNLSIEPEFAELVNYFKRSK
jgi:hypothetical protein